MLLTFSIIGFMEVFTEKIRKSVLVIAGVTVFAVCINILSLSAIYFKMSKHKTDLTEGIAKWPETDQGLFYPFPDVADRLLQQSVEKQIYIPPTFQNKHDRQN
jgi:TRAP-type C4-dicarboxylate transport system permease small subunit